MNKYKIIVASPHYHCEGPGRTCDTRAEDAVRIFRAELSKSYIFNYFDVSYHIAKTLRATGDLNRKETRGWDYRIDLDADITESLANYDKVIILELHSFINDGPVMYELFNGQQIVVIANKHFEPTLKYITDTINDTKLKIKSDRGKPIYDIQAQAAEKKNKKLIAYLLEFNENKDKLTENNIVKFAQDMLLELQTKIVEDKSLRYDNKTVAKYIKKGVDPNIKYKVKASSTEIYEDDKKSTEKVKTFTRTNIDGGGLNGLSFHQMFKLLLVIFLVIIFGIYKFIKRFAFPTGTKKLKEQNNTEYNDSNMVT